MEIHVTRTEPRDYSGLPEHLRDPLRLYIEEGYPVGSFLTCVLENDLKGACEKADSVNRYRLFDIVSWLYNNAPYRSWGHPHAVQEWHQHMAEERHRAELESMAQDARNAEEGQQLYDSGYFESH